VPKSRHAEMSRVANVADEARDVRVVRVELERLDTLLGVVDDDEATAEGVERAAHQLRRLAVPRDEQERS
jgi:hypothetical protein